LYDFPARQYATQGRWPSPDPAGLDAAHLDIPQSLNRYAYVLNNPLSLLDLFGRDFCYWDQDRSHDDPPEEGGATQDECESAGGTWVYSGGSNTVTVVATGGNPGQTGGYGCADVYLDGIFIGNTCDVTNSQGGFTLTFGVRDSNESFGQCMERNASNYSAAGLVDNTINATGETGVRVGNDVVTSTFLGNPITGTYFAFAGSTPQSAFNAGTTAAGFTGNIAQAGMGEVLTHGRRTTQIIALNLAGKGGVPKALSSVPTAGAKSFLGRLGTGALQIAANVGFTLAEAVGCSIRR
jgi:hypothetical protein